MILVVPTNRIKIALLSYGTDLSGLFILAQSRNACILARNLKRLRLGLPAGHYLADRDEKYVIMHQNMRSQGLTGLSEPIAPSEIALRYALSTLTKRTDFNFYLFRVLIFLINILFTLLKSESLFLRCNSEFFDQTTQSCDQLGVVGWLDR